jgi:quinohemoprotein ethanol dehydrogenase
MEQHRTGEIPKMNAKPAQTILEPQRRPAMKKTHSGLLVLAGALLCLGASTAATAQNAQDRAAAATKRVDGSFIRANAAQKKTPDWPSVGLDYSESRFSQLDQVNAGNVKQLGLVWSYNLESTRGAPVMV